jgi:hypothetical protein
MLVVSYRIFHKRRRKIMALISSKARAGIAALTFAAVVAPFVLATPAKALKIQILDVEDFPPADRFDIELFVDGKRDFFDRRLGREHWATKFYTQSISVPVQFFSSTTTQIGKIGLVEPGTNDLSDVVIATVITTVFGILNPGRGIGAVSIEFISDSPFGEQLPSASRRVEENADCGCSLSLPVELGGPARPFLDEATGEDVLLPAEFKLLVLSGGCESVCPRPRSVPAPVVGAGLPGLLAAGVSLFAWWRRRQKIA